MDTSPHILIVDDQRDIREPLGRYLLKHGLRVSAAADAAQARDLLKRSAVDLVVLDIMMPGEDGRNALHRAWRRVTSSSASRTTPPV